MPELPVLLLVCYLLERPAARGPTRWFCVVVSFVAVVVQPIRGSAPSELMARRSLAPAQVRVHCRVVPWTV